MTTAAPGSKRRRCGNEFFRTLHDRAARGPHASRLEAAVWRSPALLSRFGQRKLLEEHRGCVNTLHWSSDGHLLLSGSDDCRVCIWSIAGADKATLSSGIITGHRRNIFSACFVPETGNRQIVTCALDRQVRWLDLDRETNKHLLTCRQFCSKLAFVPGSAACFLSAGQDGRISHFDLREHTSPCTEASSRVGVNLSHIGGCTALAFDPAGEGHHFAVGCDDPTVRVFDIRRLNYANPQHSEPVFQYAPRTLLPSRSGRRQQWERMASGPSGLAYAPTGELIVNMRGHDVYRFASMRDVLAATTTHEADADEGPNASVEVAVSTDGAGSSSADAPPESPTCRAAAAAQPRTRAGTDADTDAADAAEVTERAEPHTQRLWLRDGDEDVPDAADDGPMDAAVRSYHEMRRPLLDAPSCARAGLQLVDGVPTITAVMRTYSGRANEETFAKEVCLLHDGAYVATGGDCGNVYLWGTHSGRLLYRGRGDASIVNCVCPHPSLPLLAVSGIDDDIKLFGLGEPRPPTLRAGGPRRARCPEGARGPDVALMARYTQEEIEGWAMDADGPPPERVAESEARAALDAASALREAGNESFKNRATREAQRKYEAALDALHVDPPGAAQRSELDDARRRVWLNLAAVSLKRCHYEAAVGWCDFVLTSSPTDVKALYRRAQAHIALGALGLAEQGLKTACDLDPEDPLLIKLRGTLQREREELEEEYSLVPVDAMTSGRVARFDSEDDDEDDDEEEEDEEEEEDDDDDDDDELVSELLNEAEDDEAEVDDDDDEDDSEEEDDEEDDEAAPTVD